MTEKPFLRGRRVLVTGATGFIGSHLVRRLLGEGSEIHIFLRNDVRCFRISDVMPRLITWRGDLINFQEVLSCIRNSRPHFIYHLAAYRDVERHLDLIDAMIETNIRGTANLLKAVLDEKIAIECLINTGTCEEYGDGPVPFSEKQKEMPVSPYSATKVATTYLSQMVFKTTGLPIITLRPFLTYGPYQDTNMFIPSLIYHCLTGQHFLMTEGNQTRDFNYIDDIVEGFLLAAVSSKAIGEIINIGSAIEYTITDVAEKIVEITQAPTRLLKGALRKRPGEAPHFFCNNEKARILLNWEPKMTLDEGLKKTVSWYKDNLHLFPDISQYTLNPRTYRNP